MLDNVILKYPRILHLSQTQNKTMRNRPAKCMLIAKNPMQTTRRATTDLSYT